MNNSLVSVVVPTFNSVKTLAKCLGSIEKQTYNNIEVIVVDSFSQDGTIKLARKFNSKVVQTDWKLLGSRYLGLKKCNGNVIFLLDSDQILESTLIERAVNLLKTGYDMLCLEEFTFEPNGWIQKLFEADRILIHKFAEVNLDPLEGVLLARVYRKRILDKVFDSIPEKLFKNVIAHDHAIIYYEAHKISQKIGIVPHAIWHIEPNSLWSLVKKNYKYGQTTFNLAKIVRYKNLLKKKVRFRKGALKYWRFGLQTYLLLILKGIGYYAGYFSQRIRMLAR